MTARLLIVNADDYGLTPGVCEGILQAHRAGAVTSTSALAVAPAFDGWVSAARDAGLDVGVHLCLVGEDPPVLTAGEIPTLVDDRGHFPRSWRQLAPRVLAGRVDHDDLRRELDAQVQRVIDSGIEPSHLDSHQHVHLLAPIARVAVELAGHHGIPAMRVPWSDGVGPRGAAVRALARRLRRRLDAADIVSPERFAGLDRSGSMDQAGLIDELRPMLASPATTMELGTHPGTPVDPDRDRYDWGFRWPEELRALTSVSTRQVIDEAGVTLAGFRELAATR